MRHTTPSKGLHQVRHAVVGLGHISQTAVLPAFAHARENAQLVALVSGDPRKLEKLSRKYKVEHTDSYEQSADCLKSGEAYAVNIALPREPRRYSRQS